MGHKGTDISGGRACTLNLFSGDDRILIPISWCIARACFSLLLLLLLSSATNECMINA